MMEALFESLGWWSGLGFVVIATYFWRGLGILLSGHVDQNSEIFRWLSAVTYSLVGALTFKLIILPIGLLSNVPLGYRIGVCLICIWWMLRRPNNMVPCLILGSLLMMAYGLVEMFI